MRGGARSPEELEVLLEDAFVMQDAEALAGLFEDGGILVPVNGSRAARGSQEMTRWTRAICERGGTYLPEERRILETRNTALVLAGGSVNVMRCGPEGSWRYAISLIEISEGRS